MKNDNPPVAQAIFDKHTAVRKKIENANFAAINALLKKYPAANTTVASLGNTFVQFGQQRPNVGE